VELRRELEAWCWADGRDAHATAHLALMEHSHLGCGWLQASRLEYAFAMPRLDCSRDDCGQPQPRWLCSTVRATGQCSQRLMLVQHLFS
jgi:hypothetical protein